MQEVDRVQLHRCADGADVLHRHQLAEGCQLLRAVIQPLQGLAEVKFLQRAGAVRQGAEGAGEVGPGGV